MSTRISWAALVEGVMNGGVEDRAAAERALRATLDGLGERLTTDEARALAARLPDELAHVFDDTACGEELDAPELYHRIWQRFRETPLGIAKEEADLVLRALGAALEPDLRTRLVRALPEPMGELLLAPLHGEPPPHPPARRAPPIATLAHARPGSRHSVAESAPRSGHTHSVARNDEPHADTKLSSSRGLTQEELGETLATGQPPHPARPISETNDD